MARFLFIAILLGGTVASVAHAQEDVEAREEAIFGDDTDEPAPAAAQVTPTTSGPLLGDPRLAEPADIQTELLLDRTQIGGFFYLRSSASHLDGRDLSDLNLGQSTLVDLYLDSRPSTRVRAFVRGRMVHDPMRDVRPATALLPGQTAATAGQDEERVLLDQLWLKFDVQRRVYVTLGQQQVRWGATRLWNPVDVINQNRRDPLTFFDERTGVPMARLHVPVESLGWNFYALALVDDATALDQVGLAGRAEIVAGMAELGLVGLARKGVDPKVGADLSAGVGPFDVTAELGITFTDEDMPWQASLGASWTWAYAEDDALVLGLEYFHNPGGYGSAGAVVDALIDFGTQPVADPSARRALPITPFYIGRNYAAALAVLMSPGSWNDTSFTAVAMANLSEGSGLARLDMRTQALTWLGIEGYVTGYGGDGEFSFYAETLRRKLGPTLTQGLRAPVWQAGLNFRMNL